MPDSLPTNYEDFMQTPLSRWHTLRVGNGQLAVTHEGLRLLIPSAQRAVYSDAQIDDYAGLPRRRFPWSPPLRLVVSARAQGALAGTAGFGFWNNPFSPLGGRPSLPSALWFFHASPPSDMPLAFGVPGFGWKAATIDAYRAAALVWAPLAAPVALANNVPAFQQRIWPRVQRALRIAEAPIPPLGNAWNSYAIEWRRDGARFSVDGQTVFETDRAPRGPLGFIAWIDNQWAIVDPRGRFGWGLLDTATQSLDIASIDIEPL